MSAPAAIRTTLGEVGALGFECDAGIADNVPSGLTQWRCSGTVSGKGAVVDVDGNDSGVTGLTLAINSADPAISRAEFRRLATSVSLLKADVGMASALDTWTGAQDPTFVGGAHFNGECDATQCLVFVSFADVPTQPPAASAPPTE